MINEVYFLFNSAIQEAAGRVGGGRAGPGQVAGSRSLGPSILGSKKTHLQIHSLWLAEVVFGWFCPVPGASGASCKTTPA